MSHLVCPQTPVVQALAADPSELRTRAERLAAELREVVPAEAVGSTAAVGGGGAPGVDLPSAAVALPAELAERLRGDRVLPVVGRVERGRLLLDLVAVPPEEDADLLAAVRRAVTGERG